MQREAARYDQVQQRETPAQRRAQFFQSADPDTREPWQLTDAELATAEAQKSAPLSFEAALRWANGYYWRHRRDFSDGAPARP